MWILTAKSQLVNLDHIEFIEIVDTRKIVLDSQRVPDNHSYALRARTATTREFVIDSGSKKYCEGQLKTISELVNLGELL